MKEIVHVSHSEMSKGDQATLFVPELKRGAFKRMDGTRLVDSHKYLVADRCWSSLRVVCCSLCQIVISLKRF